MFFFVCFVSLVVSKGRIRESSSEKSYFLVSIQLKTFITHIQPNEEGFRIYRSQTTQCILYNFLLTACIKTEQVQKAGNFCLQMDRSSWGYNNKWFQISLSRIIFLLSFQVSELNPLPVWRRSTELLKLYQSRESVQYVLSSRKHHWDCRVPVSGSAAWNKEVINSTKCNTNQLLKLSNHHLEPWKGHGYYEAPGEVRSSLYKGENTY